jgi:Domain of unknown function (DUF4440)
MADIAKDIADLRILNAKFIHNFITCDVASHSRIIHPRFICISSAGGIQERSSYLHDWATDFDPELIPYWDTRNEQIDVFGNVALVRSTNNYIRMVNGQKVTGMTTYTDTYIREHSWQCIQAQLTPVSPENYPSDNTIVSVYLKGILQQSAPK